MKIRLILAAQNSGWVIDKMAERLADGIRQLGVSADVESTPDSTADVNHWMSFAFAPGCSGTVNTMFVTHVDDPYKVSLIRQRLESTIDMALCMSPQARSELLAFGVPSEKIWYVLPALDKPIPPRRVRIGITTRLYGDGRKREGLLSRLAEEMSLNQFSFQIFGAGWDHIIPKLVEAGATVTYDPGSDDWQGDYARIVASVPNFDFYLYMGMDEGSLGTLDAHSAGVKTIVTAQGFHLSLPGGISHPFVDYQELKIIFSRLAENNIAAGARLSQWTWQAYAREHIAIWSELLKGHDSAPPEGRLAEITNRSAHSQTVPESVGHIALPRAWFYWRMGSPRRIVGALARLRILQSLRTFLRR